MVLPVTHRLQASPLLAMSGYRPLLFLIGAGLALVMGSVLLRKRRGACSAEGLRSLGSAWLNAGILAFAIIYGVGRFVVAGVIERL